MPRKRTPRCESVLVAFLNLQDKQPSKMQCSLGTGHRGAHTRMPFLWIGEVAWRTSDAT